MFRRQISTLTFTSSSSSFQTTLHNERKVNLLGRKIIKYYYNIVLKQKSSKKATERVKTNGMEWKGKRRRTDKGCNRFYESLIKSENHFSLPLCCFLHFQGIERMSRSLWEAFRNYHVRNSVGELNEFSCSLKNNLHLVP